MPFELNGALIKFGCSLILAAAEPNGEVNEDEAEEDEDGDDNVNLTGGVTVTAAVVAALLQLISMLFMRGGMLAARFCLNFLLLRWVTRPPR